jgi:hypothetical protein
LPLLFQRNRDTHAGRQERGEKDIRVPFPSLLMQKQPFSVTRSIDKQRKRRGRRRGNRCLLK